MTSARTVFWAATCLAAGRGALAVPAPPNLAEILERFDHLAVGKAVAVNDLRLTAGHFEVVASGRAAPVTAGEETVGIFVEGVTAMTYLSVDPIEAPSVIFNAKKGSDLAPEKTPQGIRLRDRPTRVLWLAQGLALPALAGGPEGADVEAAFRAQRDKFRRVNLAPLSHDFAIQRLDAPSAPMVWVEMDGGADDLLYRLNGTLDPSENLGVLAATDWNDAELRKYLYYETLSSQVIGRDRRTPPTPRVVLSDVDVDLRASAGHDATLTVVETLVPVGSPLAAVRLSLDRVIYTQEGRNLATREERLRQVTDEAGRALAFSHVMDEVLIELAEPAPPERPLKLKFEIDGDFLVRPGGDSYWHLGGPWYPQPSLAGQLHTFHATVRVKKPFVPFAPGTTLRRSADGDENLLETRIDKPVRFVAILAGNYDVAEEVRNGITIRVATYALKNPRAARQLTGLAESIIQYYQEFLGPFPMPEFNIIEINAFGFGQAPPGTMFITKEAFNPLHDEMTQLYSQGINETFAHEIAHQYWGTSVKWPSSEEQWLSESFAEYCAGLFLKVYKNEATFNMLVKHWRTRGKWATDAAPIPLANRIYVASDSTTRQSFRTGLLYNKGPTLLHALHKELGDEAFFTFLKSYQKSFAWKFGSTKTVAGLLQYMTKKDYMPFFEKFYWGTEMPKD